MKFFPFRSVIPKQEVASRVVSLGSGKLPLKWLQKRAQEEPLSYLRVVKPQYTNEKLDQGTDEFYYTCKENFDILLNSGALMELPEGLCYYRQSKPDGQHYEGWIVGVTADGYQSGRIVRHENTIKSKVGRLLKYLRTLDSMAEPVLLAQTLPQRVLELGKELSSDIPVLKFTDNQSLEHELFSLPSEDSRCQEILEILRSLKQVYIADGHHRVAACSAYLEGRLEMGFMALLLDDKELSIKSFHRIYTDSKWNLSIKSLTEYLTILGMSHEYVSEETIELKHGECMLLHKEGALKIALSKPIGSNAVENLDVYQLEKQILGPLLGVVDSSSDERLGFLRGDTEIEILREQLNEDAIQLAMILAPCSMEEVKRIGDQGLTMPPKSTWIEPKMQTGMITQLF